MPVLLQMILRAGELYSPLFTYIELCDPRLLFKVVKAD